MYDYWQWGYYVTCQTVPSPDTQCSEYQWQYWGDNTEVGVTVGTSPNRRLLCQTTHLQSLVVSTANSTHISCMTSGTVTARHTEHSQTPMQHLQQARITETFQRLRGFIGSLLERDSEMRNNSTHLEHNAFHNVSAFFILVSFLYIHI